MMVEIVVEKQSMDRLQDISTRDFSTLYWVIGWKGLESLWFKIWGWKFRGLKSAATDEQYSYYNCNECICHDSGYTANTINCPVYLIMWMGDDYCDDTSNIEGM